MEDIENVYKAIDCFSGQNAEESGLAAKWLSEFQKSVYAWQTADTLLCHNRHYHACYFGAQTIRQKILTDFRELPSDSYVSLRDSLIQHLKRVERQNPEHYAVIVTQLSLALADLYLQVPAWIGFINEIVNMFAGGEDGSLNIMLSLLRVFPEELLGRQLKLGANRREAVQQELAANFDTLVDSLTHILANHQNDPGMIKKVIQCISPWINNPLNNTEKFAQSQLLQNMLQLLNMTNIPSDIYDANTDALSSAVILCERINEHFKLASVLQQGIYSSAETFKALVAAEDFDKLASLAKLYVETAESFLEEMANNPGKNLGDLRTLDLILLVVEYHDYSLAEMSFNVWYRLSEFVFQITDDVSYTYLMNAYKPYVERYILCLFKHCQLDIDFEGIQDEKDDFIEFRDKAAETIKDVSFIIGSVNLVKSMLLLIESNKSGHWNEIESALFILSTVISNVTDSEEESIPMVLNIILHCSNSGHDALLNTAVQIMGSLSEWLEPHTEHMTTAVNCLISLSAKEELIKSVAEAIESICKINYPKLRVVFPELVNFMHRVESCKVNGVRAEAAAQAILRSCTYLLNDIPSQDIANQLEELCRDPVERLNKLANIHANGQVAGGNENARDSWARTSTDPLIWIDRLTAIFKTLKPWNAQQAFKVEAQHHNVTPFIFETVPALQVPWLSLGGRVWGAISITLEAYQSNFRTAEHCCRCFRYLIRSMGPQSVVFVNSLASLIIRVYNTHPHSCFLYLGSVIVDEYAAFPNVVEELLKMGQVIANRSFMLFQQPNGLQNNPDTVDDLFRLAFRFVQRVPGSFFSNPLSKNLFGCAVEGLELDHLDGHRSITKFLEETLNSVKIAKDAGDKHPAIDAVDDLFNQYGEKMIWHCISGSLTIVGNNLKKDLAEVMYQVFVAYKNKFSVWLTSAVQRLAQERGSLGASAEQLEKFHENAIKCTRTSEFCAVMKEFCKLYS